jgi:hypothetical protein
MSKEKTMGMYDESWCNSCGCSVPYSEDEYVCCGPCERETAVDLIEGIIRYTENLKNELEERLTTVDGADTIYHYLEGAVEYTDLILLEMKDRYQNA